MLENEVIKLFAVVCMREYIVLPIDEVKHMFSFVKQLYTVKGKEMKSIYIAPLDSV